MNNKFNIKTFNTIKKLYWDEGYDQQDIGLKFKCDQSTVSRILRDIYRPIEVRRKEKKLKYSPNFKPSPNEPKQAKTLRCMREQLPKTKLSVVIAKDIRKSYFNGTKTQVELAQKYKVNQSTVCKLIMGQDWKICKC
jgi:DNA-binding transcriptional regulator LsrR (DeoR family)